MRQHPVIEAPPAQPTLTGDEFPPSGRGVGTWHQLHPRAGQQRQPYDCPFAIHQEFLAAGVRKRVGSRRCGLTLGCSPSCAPGGPGGACASCEFSGSCRGGCMAAKFFTGLPLDGPDPECVPGHGAEARKLADPAAAPRPAPDHSHRGPARARAAVGRQPGGQRRPAPVPVTIGRPPGRAASPASPPARGCDDSPLAGFVPTPPRTGTDQEPASGRLSK
jgi:hypothetical protein